MLLLFMSTNVVQTSEISNSLKNLMVLFCILKLIKAADYT